MSKYSRIGSVTLIYHECQEKWKDGCGLVIARESFDFIALNNELILQRSLLT